MLKRIGVAIAALAMGGAVLTTSANADEAKPGDTPENPIVVADPVDVPEGAVEDEVSTWPGGECETTRSWVLTIPATDAKTHEESRYRRVVEGTAETFHDEWSVSERTRTVIPGKTHPAVPGFWTNFQPTNMNEPFQGPPTYPTDPRGTWSAPKTDGGPQQGVEGVFQNGSGNGSWFYRQQTVPEYTDPDTYSAWSAWAVTQPLTAIKPSVPGNTDVHEWRIDGPVSVGNGDATEGYTEFYTGKPGGSKNEDDAAWVAYVPGGGYEAFDTRTVTDEEGTEESVVYFAWSDGVECEVPGPEPTEPTPEPNAPVKPAPKPGTDKPAKKAAHPSLAPGAGL